MSNRTRIPQKNSSRPAGCETPSRYGAWDRIKTIKAAYPDYVPLRRDDRAFMLLVLRGHPRAREKFGAGINHIVLAPYIGKSRCFWVIRADGTAEDFSARKAVTGRRGQPRSRGILAMMSAWDTQATIRGFLQLRALRKPSVTPREAVKAARKGAGR